jgi:hypothetical protein
MKSFKKLSSAQKKAKLILSELHSIDPTAPYEITIHRAEEHRSFSDCTEKQKEKMTGSFTLQFYSPSQKIHSIVHLAHEGYPITDSRQAFAISRIS